MNTLMKAASLSETNAVEMFRIVCWYPSSEVRRTVYLSTSEVKKGAVMILVT